MWLRACWRGSRCAAHLLQRVSTTLNSSATHAAGSQLTGKPLVLARSFAPNFLLEEVEDVNDSISQMQKSTAPISLAKSLACLPDESSTVDKRKPRSRMELKRLIELRIKKRVKAQYIAGKFYNLMEKVIANADTLEDSYDIIRLNSNVDLASKRDDICFSSLAVQLTSGDFDVSVNTLSMYAKNRRKECLVFPKLELKVIQEAIRVVLEIVYRPHFSKISHGCRSGRGHRSALRYIHEEIGKHDWWFTISINKEADDDIISKLILEMGEKIEDARLFTLIRYIFDARVLNLVFGGFPKGHGLPQEGVLSPILMNIYLDIFDREVFSIRMRYEGLGSDSGEVKDSQRSNLRRWIRRQMNENNDENDEQSNVVETRLCACRYMDEIFIAISGSKDSALNVKSEMITYLKNSLYLDVEDRTDVKAIKKSSRGVQFLGAAIRVSARESAALRAVHKLKDKVQLFASQKQEIWDAMTLRIGKKWLAYGLRRVKESEIKNLGLSTPLLDHISQYRRAGMKTDHWFKSLLKVWMQDVNAKVESSEEVVLSKYIAEPALPADLQESFYNFQKQAKEYVSSEKAATLALLQASNTSTGAIPSTDTTVTKIEASTSFIRKSLYRNGLINIEGFPRHVSALVLQDDVLIVNWFSGLIRRWLKWYSEFDNFGDIKFMIVECIRKSCIRTLAAKYRMHEHMIDKRFELEQSGIPSTEDLESEMASSVSDSLICDDDEALTYGISNSGLCLLSLSRVKVPTRIFNCFIMGCTVSSPSMYTLHVKERQRFPGWKTGFSTSIHPSLHGKRIGLCVQHVKDLYLGHISLQSIEFGALKK